MGEKEAEKQAAYWIDRVILPATKKIIPANYRAVCSNEWVLPEPRNGCGYFLMDEAFSALDPLIRTDMQNILLDLSKSSIKPLSLSPTIWKSAPHWRSDRNLERR